MDYIENKKIIFIKTVSIGACSTEHMALNVLNDPKYDEFPQYIDKEEIQRAFDDYGYILNPYNSELYSLGMNSPNVEGHFLAQNIPKINSVVFDEKCDEQILHKILDKDSEITHIGLSTYAEGMDNTIDIIKTILTDYPDKTLYIGGMGTLYSPITRLVDRRNICFGNGINWLRQKLELNQLHPQEFEIPVILSDFLGLDQHIWFPKLDVLLNVISALLLDFYNIVHFVTVIK